MWDEGALAGLDSAAQRDQYAELAKQPGAVAKKEGDAAAALAQATKRLDAVYEFPYLAHAPMEPLNCVADVRADGADVWTGTQFQTIEQMVAAVGRFPPLPQWYQGKSVQLELTLRFPDAVEKSP